MCNEYNPFERMTFSYDRCFLCGKLLTEENSSDEHVFPRWLQHKFNLWNQELVLLNGTTIKYRNLKIPCCSKCNNEYLSKVEKKIEQAVEGGYSEFVKLDENIIAIWLAKLSYGMLFKELSLKADITNANSASIVTPEILKDFKCLYTLLQTIMYDTKFEGKPWSVLVFNIYINDDMVYDAQDLLFQNCYFMRMNDIGIIANLQDGGCSKDFFIEHMGKFLDIKLEYIQFREICAKFLYKSSLLIKRPFYTFIFPHNKEEKCVVVTQEMIGEIFERWSQKEYAEVLEIFLRPWKNKYKKIYYDDDHILTFLYKSDGSINELKDTI
ncbi:MAG: HNH endonuclease [Clostridium sp.]|jgi:hypothetical protein|nr:HNH endonuclease [Clostridium sp.]